MIRGAGLRRINKPVFASRRLSIILAGGASAFDMGAEGEVMTGYELHDLLSGNRELISNTWNYFLTVHLALLGVIFVASGGINTIQRVVLFGAYAAFMYMNYAAQLDNYTFYIRLIEEIDAMPNDADGAMTAKSLATMDPVWIVDWLREVYLAAGVTCGLVIMLIKRERDEVSRW